MELNEAQSSARVTLGRHTSQRRLAPIGSSTDVVVIGRPIVSSQNVGGKKQSGRCHPRGSHRGDTQANVDWSRLEALLTLWLVTGSPIISSQNVGGKKHRDRCVTTS